MNIHLGWKSSVAVLTAFGLGIGSGMLSAANSAKQLSIIAAGDAKFAPFDPKQPHSPQLAVLSGDPRTGPVAFLLKTEKGPAPIHWHSSDYYSVTLVGQSKHWMAGKDADAKALAPNSFWFQPGGSAATAHGDECLSDGGCTMFIFMPGKLDFTPIAAAKK